MQEPDTWLFIEAGFGICMRWSTLVVLFNFNFFFAVGLGNQPGIAWRC